MTDRRGAYLGVLAMWAAFLIMAMSLGALREGVIAPYTGAQTAHVIGTILFVVAMLAIMWAFFARIRHAVGPKDLWIIGGIWTSLTVGFEFLFFHFVAGVAWEKLLADYNILAGRLWVLVLLTTLCGPAWIGRLQSSSRLRSSEAEDQRKL